MDDIRLRRVGLISYSSMLITTVTGLLFTVIITRRLTPEELGIWRYIGTLISYFTIPAGIISYWSTRLTAADKPVMASSLFLATAFATPLTITFITFSPSFSSTVSSAVLVFFIASLEIPFIYLYTILDSIALAKKPQTIYYAQLIQEFVKLPVAIILVLFLRTGLTGAIMAAAISFAARVVSNFILLRSLQKGGVNINFIRSILGASWLPLYTSFSTQVLALDTFVVVLTMGSAELLGYASAVFLLGSLVTLSGNLAAGLYPRMLQKPSGRDIENSLSLVLMLAIPSAIGIVVFSQQLLNILRPDYVAVYPVVTVGVIHSIIFIIGNMADAIITGQERSDIIEGMSFRTLIRSKLLLPPTINYLQALIYIPLLSAALSIIKTADTLTMLTIWFTINLIIYSAAVAYKLKISHDLVRFKWPTRSIFNYLISSIPIVAMGVYMYPEDLPKEVLPALLRISPIIALSAATYFILVFVLDREFRGLVKAIISEIKGYS